MISFQGVSKAFKRTPVLAGLDLDIGKGERVALVGSNGAGKTTLIRCLLGEYTYKGEIVVDGLAPRRDRRELLGRIGFVPQLPPPLKMPVAQLLRFASELSCCDRTRIEDVALSLGLDVAKFRHQPFVKMSGGQKQKLLIAIALGRETNVLIMDEPAANLDPEARHQFFGLLAERAGDASMLISSHRLDEVAALVNRVIELDQGKVVLDDRVMDEVSLDSVLNCRLTFVRAEPAIIKALGEWKFRDTGRGLSWQGKVAGPDRLRFLGLLSRYAALIKGIDLQEESRT